MPSKKERRVPGPLCNHRSVQGRNQPLPGSHWWPHPSQTALGHTKKKDGRQSVRKLIWWKVICLFTCLLWSDTIIKVRGGQSTQPYYLS